MIFGLILPRAIGSVHFVSGAGSAACINRINFTLPFGSAKWLQLAKAHKRTNMNMNIRRVFNWARVKCQRRHERLQNTRISVNQSLSLFRHWISVIARVEHRDTFGAPIN